MLNNVIRIIVYYADYVKQIVIVFIDSQKLPAFG